MARTEFAFIPSPVGRLLAAVEDGALRVLEFADTGRRASTPDPAWEPDQGGLAAIRGELDAYFAGRLRDFTMEVRPAYGTDFQRRVWTELRRIPYGDTISYGDLARRLGDPKAVRAVGLANGANPVAIVVPCHRVIGANGSLTGYGGGLPIKQALLALERGQRTLLSSRRTRREFLATTALAAGALPLVGARTPEAAPREQAGAARRVFRHGVASGDPLPDAVLLWTRVTSASPSVPVRWLLATDPALRRIVARGETTALAARDHTVKLDVGGLSPATTYYYRFDAQGEASPVGRTRTFPGRDAASLRLAVVSCANYPVGFFNVYARLGARSDLDAVLHLGDYIYEYGERPQDGGREKGRLPRPLHEVLTLADYRDRLAHYREDPDLQEAHRQHPWIAVWDDHEFANDSWPGGADNHQPDTEGPWAPRRDAAAQAYLEWLPVREDRQSLQRRIYRTFRAGTLCDLVMLDARMAGRDAPATSLKDVATLEDPARSILGRAQEGWLEGELAASARDGVRWPMLGQQIMFAPQVPAGQPTFNEDSWDGYRPARGRVFELVERLRLPNFVVLTGDVHSSWGYDLPPRVFTSGGYDPATGRGSVGIELITPAVTSSSGFGAPAVRDQRVATLLAARPHLRYLEPEKRGYVVVDITPARVQAEWWLVPTVTEKTTAEACDRAMVCEAGARHLVTTGSVVPRSRTAAPAP